MVKMGDWLNRSMEDWLIWEIVELLNGRKVYFIFLRFSSSRITIV